MKKILHQVWVQGESELPQAYIKNRELWRKKLPDDWEMKLWDADSAAAEFPDYADLHDQCSCHAMRADLILARALFKHGGLICGTDAIPVNIPPMIEACEVEKKAWVVLENGDDTQWSSGPIAISCGLAFAIPGHPFFQHISNIQAIRVAQRLHVLKATGPGCWTDCYLSGWWDLGAHSFARAFTHRWDEKGPHRWEAFINPGYAGSW